MRPTAACESPGAAAAEAGRWAGGWTRATEAGEEMKRGLTAGGGLVLGMIFGLALGHMVLGMVFGLLIGAAAAARRSRTKRDAS